MIEDKLYRCKYYLNKKYKCKANAILDKEDKLLSYDDNHSCGIEEKKINSLKVITEVKTTVNNIGNIYSVKA